MIRKGKLSHFTVGKLLRISAEEVERCERHGSSSTEAGSPSASLKADNDGAILLARRIRGSRGPVLLNGNNSTND
jgi:hypothetical protein